ncbi:MAG: type II toxin-antitoxin system RelE/ParE family toxin [Oculatellaceae cyanobacterium bins.114]|nr:type II toxin-antitoxin system RelE/ParE family toxin [Oculatellaceae cyanobacterium bins.114]
MTRRRFKLAKLARKDLDDIWLAIAQHNLDSADNMLDEIQKRFLLLARFKEMGVVREDLAPELRSFPVDQYLICYRLTKQGIEIVRVLPGRADLKRFFLKEE